MKHAKSIYNVSALILLPWLVATTGCQCSGTTTAGNTVSANGKWSMTVAANPVVVRTNTTTTVTATVTNLQPDGVTWQPAIGARVVFSLTPYPNNDCGSLVPPVDVQTDASGVATVKFKASNAPTTPSADTCYVYVVAKRTFTLDTASNVSDSITLKIK